MLRTLLTVLLVLSFVISVPAGEINAKKKAAIEELLDATGAEFLSEQMAFLVMEQMAAALKKSSGDVPLRAMEILTEEAQLLLHEHFVEHGGLNDLVFPIYDKYFTEKEIREIAKFYKTKTGKKVVLLMPKIMQESMAAGQRTAEDMMPLLRERLKQRFEAEHIDLL